MLGTVLFLVIAAAVLLGFFRIRTLEVLGVQRYSAEEIKSDLVYDFWTENTLYFAWKYRNAVSDPRTPYLDSVQVKMLSPGKARVQVKEKKLSGCVSYAGSSVYFDTQGVVLDITDKTYDGIPQVSGVTMDEPVLYQKLPVGNTAQLRTMLNITRLLIEAKLIPDNIAFDENLNITLKIGSVEVKLGQDEYLEEKVANLVTIYQEVASQTGTLNMEAFTGKNETITFKKSDEPANTVETDAQGNPVNTGETDADGNPVGTGETDADGNPVGTGETDAQGNPVGAGETDADGNPTGSGESAGAGSQADTSGETTGVSAFMVFDSSGTLRYDAHVVNGQVVDAYGNPIDGCSVDENGNVVDAYWNVIDPMTGQLAQ